MAGPNGFHVTTREMFRYVSGSLDPARAAEITRQAETNSELAGQLEFFRHFTAKNGGTTNVHCEAAPKPTDVIPDNNRLPERPRQTVLHIEMLERILFFAIIMLTVDVGFSIYRWYAYGHAYDMWFYNGGLLLMCGYGYMCASKVLTNYKCMLTQRDYNTKMFYYLACHIIKSHTDRIVRYYDEDETRLAARGALDALCSAISASVGAGCRASVITLTRSSDGRELVDRTDEEAISPSRYLVDYARDTVALATTLPQPANVGIAIEDEPRFQEFLVPGNTLRIAINDKRHPIKSAIHKASNDMGPAGAYQSEAILPIRMSNADHVTVVLIGFLVIECVQRRGLSNIDNSEILLGEQFPNLLYDFISCHYRMKKRAVDTIQEANLSQS